jgi:small nuclear ribonucleoprotein (snRNP)-like protein
MREKARAEIIVRHKTGLRGVLTGYVVAADRHANLLLADVDETAAAYGKKISIRALREASRLETTPVVRRHFDQVLVRGDNIVIVSKKSA